MSASDFLAFMLSGLIIIGYCRYQLSRPKSRWVAHVRAETAAFRMEWRGR